MTHTANIVQPLAGQKLKRGGLIWLGVILLLAFFMPLVQPNYNVQSFRTTGQPEYTLKFTNIEILTSEQDIPGSVRFGAALPGIAGIVIIIAAAATPKLACSVIVTALGLLTYAAALLGPNTQQTMNLLPRGGAGNTVLIYVLILSGLTGLLAGSMAKRHRPGSNLAAILGILGGLMFPAGLFIPIMPKVGGSSLAMIPVEMMRTNIQVAMVTGAVIALGMLLWLIASIICLCNIPGRRPGAARSMGASSFTCMMIGAGSLLLALIITFTSSIGDKAQYGPALMVMLKMIFGIVGLMLMLPMGLAALAISLNNDAELVQAYAAPPIAGMTPAMAATISHSSQARLQELQGLFEKGLITSQEYEAQRNKIISSL
jgi:hypothetical protein